MPQAKVIVWEEPNRADTVPLHIETHGERYSTLTGVAWLDENRFVVNHRNGLRLALFDLRQGDKPLVTTPIPHLNDDVTAKRTGDNSWEVAVSGCWDHLYSRFRLTIEDDEPQFRLIETVPQPSRTFAHGIAYDEQGKIWVALHTGDHPRIESEGRFWALPQPWGARSLCIEPKTKSMYAVAVSKNPDLVAYDDVSTSIWLYDPTADRWNCICTLKDVHSDTCKFYGEKMWLPDQRNDRVLGIDLEKKAQPIVIAGKCFDFPHGLDVSKNGILAVSNYGSSSITLLDLKG